MTWKTLPSRPTPQIPAIPAPSHTATPGMLSVITPAMNHGRYIGECIQSVERQNDTTLEHIVIDGGSTDNTVEVVSHFPNVRFTSEPDRGQSHALNKAVACAKGEYIVWLNADDTLLPNALADVTRLFRTEPTADVAVYGFEMINEFGTPIGEKLPGPRMGECDGRFSPHDCFPTPALCFRRRVFNTLGGFDEANPWTMDYDFLLRARAAGLIVLFIDRHIVRFRVHKEQKTSPQNAERRYLWTYWLNQPYWGPVYTIEHWRYRWRNQTNVGHAMTVALRRAMAEHQRWRGFLYWVLLPWRAPLWCFRRSYWGDLARLCRLRAP